MVVLKELHGGVIIAGGKGKRLLPLTAKTPKPLLTVNGKNPIERSVSALNKAGVESIAITTGYLGEEIEKCVFDKNGDISYSGESQKLNVTYYREETPLGTAGMIFKMLSTLAEDFFVISGDVIFDFSLSDMYSFHKDKNATITIATVKSFSPTEYGTVISENGKIVAFREKPSWKQIISTKINTGIYIINRKVLENIPFEFTDFASEIFPFLLLAGERLFDFETDGYWCDMGTHEDYHKCNMYKSKSKNVLGDYIAISQGANITESIIMNGVKVGENTKISSSIISEGVSIGKNCIIENAVIGPFALICDNAVLEKGSIVYEDSIVGKGKTVYKAKEKKDIFFDSGKAELEKTDKDGILFFGKALKELSKDNRIFIFHDGTADSEDVCKVISKGFLSQNGIVSSCQKSFLSLCAFAGMKNNALSVYVEDGENFVTATVFDENGLTLSREDQLIIQKASFTKENEFYPLKTENNSYNGEEAYLNTKAKDLETLSEIDILTENNPPCRLLSKIVKKKGGLCHVSLEETNGSINDNQNNKDFFYIDESGTDAFCITKNGVKIDKIGLILISAVFNPQKNISLPEYAPKGLKDAIFAYGGGYFIYGDNKNGRVKANGFLNFDDGISVVLSVLRAISLTKLELDVLYSSVPHFAFEEKTVLFSGNKAKAFEKLTQKEKSDKGETQIIPQYRNAFKIFAESVSSESATELLSKAESEVIKLLETDI